MHPISRYPILRLCRLGGFAPLLIALAACTFPAGPPAGFQRHIAVADEPQAALTGRQTMAEGGNAVDAAVSMALTMAVTLPSRVGLGGGGACLVHDPSRPDDPVRAIDFVTRPGAEGAAIPGFLRGLFALHSDYGALRWEALIAAAENQARFGVDVSRALAVDVDAADTVPAGPLGTGLRQGDRLVQPDLAATLAQVRAGGVGSFYGGSMAQRYADAARSVDVPLSAADLRGFLPEWQPPVEVVVDNDRLYFAPGAAAQGAVHAEIWTALVDRDYGDAAPDERRDMVAALGQPGTAPPGASLAVLSGDEMAVVCSFTLNALFGSGRVAPETGVILAAPPPGGPALGGLAVLANRPKNELLVAGAGTGSARSLTVPLVESWLADTPSRDAVAQPRQASGASAGGTDGEGRAVLIHCDWNRAADKRCTAVADPRGHGLASLREG